MPTRPLTLPPPVVQDLLAYLRRQAKSGCGSDRVAALRLLEALRLAREHQRTNR
jgi:hypothetical protein